LAHDGHKGEGAPAASRRAAQRRGDLGCCSGLPGRDPDASVGDIAKAAGVGRVTFYGHFPTRADLVDAVFARTVAEADEAFKGVDLTGDPRAALARLVASSWQIVNRHRALLRAAQPPGRNPGSPRSST
jgi:hypothetical protein